MHKICRDFLDFIVSVITYMLKDSWLQKSLQRDV